MKSNSVAVARSGSAKDRSPALLGSLLQCKKGQRQNTRNISARSPDAVAISGSQKGTCRSELHHVGQTVSKNGKKCIFAPEALSRRRSKCRASKPEPRRYLTAQLRVAFAHASHTPFRRCLFRQVRAYRDHGFARNAGHGLAAGPRRDISAFSTATLFFPEAADAGDRPRAARRDRAGRRSACRHTRAGYGGAESRRRASKRAHGGLYSPCAASRMRWHADRRRRRMATFSATCAFTRLATRLERTRAGHGGTPAHAPRPRRYLKPPSFEHPLTSTRLPRVPPSFSPSTFHVFR